MAEITALEKASPKTPAVITTPDEYRGALLRWQGQYNVLTPFANISGLAASHGIIATVVSLDLNASYGAEGGGGDVYGGLFLKGRRGEDTEELAIAKNGLRKLAEGGAISTKTERLDPMTITHYWSFKCIATYRGIDGSIVTRDATVEWDLRDGSDRLKGWGPNQISEGRKNGLRNCETRAINAAIREFGIKQKYTRAELKKPFVICRVMFQPDLSDPAIKRLVTERALGATTALYPAAPVLPAHTIDVEDAAEAPRSVGRSSTTAPATEVKAEDQPPTADAVKILKVEDRPFKRPGKSDGMRYVVVDSTGCEASTFDQKLADVARKYAADKTWVEVSTETQGQYTNLIEIVPAGQQPSLLPDTNKL